MNYANIQPSISFEMAKWVQNEVLAGSGAGRKEGLLLGLDCWGAVLAAQVSLATGIPASCIAARDAGRQHSASEGISDSIVDAVKRSGHVFLVSDVVVTGLTVRSVYDRLKERLPVDDHGRRWYILSIVNALTIGQAEQLSFGHKTICACSTLPMPLLDKALLPPLSVAPQSRLHGPRGEGPLFQ
jgi:hypothetical protein